MSKITREELLLVFRRLVARFGLDRVTMKELAREAGVSVGTIYRHFENKEALIASIEETWLDHVRARNAQILQREAAPEAKLYDLLVVHAARLSEIVRTDQAAFEMLMGAVRLRYIDHDVVDTRRRIFDDMIDTAAAVMVEGTTAGQLDVADAENTARHFVEAFAEYFSPAAIVSRPHAEVVEGVEGMFEFLMRGIRAR
ncbi:MAG: TetR/AcrR family transcriptional regulator [Gemmatimonadota bacterium]|nr:TetR/AcrR family transcriptional regulator [Gemmatimonadota bacterium]